MKRSEQQPALYDLARCFCETELTPSTCCKEPDNDNNCECWARAHSMLLSCGLSSRACRWVLQNTDHIEYTAELTEKYDNAEHGLD